MEELAIYGSGGFGKEIRSLLDCINRHKNQYSFKGYIDDFRTSLVQSADRTKIKNVVIAIADPRARKRIYSHSSHQYLFPNLIDPLVYVDSTVQLGKGIVICAGVKITVDVVLDDFVILNLNATIGHDVKMGPFCSVMPSANISGNVRMGEGVFVGSGATILQGLKIGDHAVIGAGAVVTKDVPPSVIAKGVPARWVNQS